MFDSFGHLVIFVKKSFALKLFKEVIKNVNKRIAPEWNILAFVIRSTCVYNDRFLWKTTKFILGVKFLGFDALSETTLPQLGIEVSSFIQCYLFTET